MMNTKENKIAKFFSSYFVANNGENNEKCKEISWEDAMKRFPKQTETNKIICYGEYLDCSSEDETYSEFFENQLEYTNKWYVSPSYPNILFSDYNDGFSSASFLYLQNGEIIQF